MSSDRTAILLEYDFIPTQRYGYQKAPHPELYNIISEKREEYRNTLTSFFKYKNYFFEIPLHNSESSLNPYWINRYLPPLDALSLYSFICLYKPANILK